MEDGVQDLKDGVQCHEILVFWLAVAVAPMESLPIWPPAPCAASGQQYQFTF